MLKNFKVRGKKKYNENEAARAVKSIRLLKKKEIHMLFPECNIHNERIFGITKSFIAYKGFGSQ